MGYDGTREEAEEIKRRIGVWLQENLKLTLSEEKTLITHAVKGAARFLGYQIVNQQYNGHIYKGSYDGLYCEGCESFKTEKEVKEAGGVCPDHKVPPVARKVDCRHSTAPDLALDVIAVADGGRELTERG